MLVVRCHHLGQRGTDVALMRTLPTRVRSVTIVDNINVSRYHTVHVSTALFAREAERNKKKGNQKR